MIEPGEPGIRLRQLVAAQPNKAGRPPLEKRHLFTGGFLRCGACGEAMVPRTRPTEGYDFYECNGQQDPGLQDRGVRRVDVDEPVLRYFEQVGLDLEATREQLTAARDRAR